MEQHMEISPTVSLVAGIVSIMTGLMLLICPGAGSAAVMILFPLWFFMHSISRLSPLGIVRRFAGNGFYYMIMLGVDSIALAVSKLGSSW